jgi:hypothetical protein
MLKPIADKIKALSDWQKEAGRHVIEEAKAFEAIILDWNTEEQLYLKGQDSEGAAIEPPYRAFTIQIKRMKGQPTDRVTLKDTGDFHRSFFIHWAALEFRIMARDAKVGKLTRKYGQEIFGLDDDGQDELTGLLKEPLIENLKRAIA